MADPIINPPGVTLDVTLTIPNPDGSTTIIQGTFPASARTRPPFPTRPAPPIGATGSTGASGSKGQ